MNIKQGDRIQVQWEVIDEDTQRPSYAWYDAVVKKIHRKDTKYYVCHIVYDDGDENKSFILWEKEYGLCWRMAKYTVDASIQCDVGRISADVRCIKTNVRFLMMFYLITYLPFWFAIYGKLVKHLVENIAV